jgi:lycopene beta-cyclase
VAQQPITDRREVCDVVVAGSGPAGAAVAAACRDRGLSVVVIGPAGAWSTTLGTWLDEVPELPGSCFRSTTDRAVVRARTERVIDRPFGLIDNVALRSHFGLDALLHPGRVERSTVVGDSVVVGVDDGESFTTRWLIDATGAAAGSAGPWQTSYAVVVSAADLVAAGHSTEGATVMAWLPGDGPARFLWAVPTGDGWLVGVTAPAASPAIEPQRLRRSLIGVLGEAPVVAAEALGRAERRQVSMGRVGLPEPGGRIVSFGAAGGLSHPATGSSLVASFRFADAVAEAIASGSDPSSVLANRAMRGARRLHAAGLEMLLGLDGERFVDVAESFFAIPTEQWSEYLRVDAPSAEVAGAMRSVFRSAPWSVRRRLLGVDVRTLAAMLRPR